jgi:hypothetical protein
MSRHITGLCAAAVTLVLATGAASGAKGGGGQTPPQNLTPPTVSGNPQVPNTLTAAPGTWKGNALKYAYQWLECDSSGANCNAIRGATSSTETLVVGLVGNTLRVLVTASNRGGSAAATSAQTTVVADEPSPPPLVGPSNDSPPTVSGTAQQGSTLTSSTGSWSGTTPITYTYQWQRCNSTGQSCAQVTGAVASTYVPTSADVGSTMRTSVTASNPAGSATASSAATAVVTQQTAGLPWRTWAAPNYLLGWTDDQNAPDHWQAAVSNGGSGLNSSYLYTVGDGSGGSATRVKIAPTSNSSTSGTMTSFYNPMPERQLTVHGSNVTASAYTAQGDDTWYRWRVRFPTGVYVPRSGSWNINVEWHESRYGSTANNCPTFPSPYFGVQADGSSSSPGTNPRLIFHFRSGLVNSGGTGIENDFIIPQHNNSGSVVPLQYDHWYDVVAHYRWEPDNAGAFEWYVDGQLQYQNLAIKTMHVFCDGTSYPYTFGVYDYQRNDGAWPSGVDFKTMDIGPTAGTVGFTP